MTQYNFFQIITFILGAVAFVVVGIVVSMFIVDNNNNDNTPTSTNINPVPSETQQIITFLSLADNAEESGLYGEADPESLQQSLQTLEESLSQTIQTQEDANLYMIYWAATAVNQCVHFDTQNREISTSDLAAETQTVEVCIDSVRDQIQENIAQMSNDEQQILMSSAASWNALTSIVEYYNLFMQNNFVQAIQQNTQPTTHTESVSNQPNTTQNQEQNRG